MEHYFIDKQHSNEDYFEFTENFEEFSFTFKSCDSIFSKDCIDYGTKVLLRTIIKKIDLKGNVLDIGCGYGAIGIILSRVFNNVKISMVDINKTAVELSKHNVIKNHCKNIEKIDVSNAYENVNEKYNFIITNPPIKAGKKNLLSILIGAKEHLEDNGELILVIKKKHGEESIKKALCENYSEVEVLNRDKGYYILRAVKWKK